MDDDGTRPGTPELQRAPWWLAGRRLSRAIVLECVWTALFVVRLVELITDRSTDVIATLVLVASGILMIGIAPSVVWLARRRPVYG